MTVYSFFLNLNHEYDYEFMIDHSHCIKDNYKGYHPVIRQSDGSLQILYAMTSSKKLKDKFMITRDMSKFVYYKSDIPIEKYKIMKERLDDTILTKTTLSDYIREKKRGIDVPVIITKYEKERVVENSDIFIINMLMSIFRPDSDISLIEHGVLTDELDSLFKSIKLNDSIDLLTYGGANDSDIEYYESDYYRILQSFTSGVKVKTLEIFINLFGNTLKED